MKAKKDPKIFLEHILESIREVDNDIPKLKKQIENLLEKF